MQGLSVAQYTQRALPTVACLAGLGMTLPLAEQAPLSRFRKIFANCWHGYATMINFMWPD
jgi:hypothetical protein